jgi:hypothetical protein
MKKTLNYLIIGLTLLFSSCGPSDKEILKQAESTVQLFVNELSIQNFSSAKEIYPNFGGISRYKVLQNFKIKSSQFSANSKKQIKVSGEFDGIRNSQSIQFTLEKNNKGSFKIINSKGLSSYYDTELFDILKSSGCLSDIESDVSIQMDCQRYEQNFNNLVQDYINKIENSIIFEKTGSNLSNNYNFYYSGDIMLKNNSVLSVPGFSYEIFIALLDASGKTIHASKYEFNNDPILANQYHQIKVFNLDYYRGTKSYTAFVKITNDQFIRDYIVENERLDCNH